MQDRYAGDVGDFGKYGLLRFLCGQREISEESPSSAPNLRLGVVWYLYPDECGNADGKHITYLMLGRRDHEAFRACDPDLYDSLRRLIEPENRNVAAVQRSMILPVDTVYYDTSLSYFPGTSRSVRQTERTSWLEGALDAMSGADLVFVDPDNGLSDPATGISRSVDPLRKKGPKYVYMDDIRRFAEPDRSLVIYHHLGRNGTVVEQIRKVADSLRTGLDLPRLPWALCYRRGTVRAYFILAQERHEPILKRRMNDFLHSEWNRAWKRYFPVPHFELVIPEKL